MGFPTVGGIDINVFYSAIPQSESDFLEAQPLQKGKTERKKKKEGKGTQQIPEAGFMTLPAPAIQSAPSGTPASGSATSSPAPRAGFSRITSIAATPVDSASHSQGGTPAPSDRIKVAFGLGIKRKAGEEPAGSPPPKRR